MNNNNSNKIINGATGSFILNIVILVLLVILSIAHNAIPNKSNNISSQKNSKKEYVKQNPVELPSTYTETYFLKKGEIYRANIPLNYSCDFSGGGKKFYIQPQNQKRVIAGGDEFISLGEHSSYFDLSCYEEEITVTLTFRLISK